MNVQEPWYSYLRTGRKSYECRLYRGKFTRWHRGMKIEIINNDSFFILPIIEVYHFSTFREALEKLGTRKDDDKVGIENILPGIESIEEGTEIYRSFYPKDLEKIYGVVVFKF